jgi:hypothetical protein
MIMNERIKELALQAEFSERDLHIQGDNFQRFAELIVQECLRQSKEVVIPITADAIESKIKEHFGVES